MPQPRRVPSTGRVRSLRPARPTGVERFFDEDELIVSKTDAHGRITYANEVFLRVADYHADEILGQPHSIIRHPAMPRGVFSLLWDTIGAGDEIFAYVVNLARNGDHYWVFAHVTPTFGPDGALVGYHSNRRVPRRSAIATIEPIYRTMCAIEADAASKRDGAEASRAFLDERLVSLGVAYDELMFALAAEEV
ncbi:MAG: PAS domain-containing protein [Sandaracinus sp.]|nr:PAS domain-containing protein [Sandaracinus sp.]MCB9636049.1 PAS domain-containing protein [Sandaracinus sp.]